MTRTRLNRLSMMALTAMLALGLGWGTAESCAYTQHALMGIAAIDVVS